MCVRTNRGHVYCDRMAGWIRMPLGKEIGLVSGHIVLDGLAFDFFYTTRKWLGGAVTDHNSSVLQAFRVKDCAASLVIVIDV